MAGWRTRLTVLGALSAIAAAVAGCGAPQTTSPGQNHPTAPGTEAPHSPAHAAASAAASHSPGAADGAGAGGPVPAGFAATSVTFVSPSEAFVLGTAPCANPPCTSIVRTLDRGATWRGLPAPVVPLHWPDASRPAVWGIRFGTPEHGFVFGNGLWETTDGGERWTSDTWTHGWIMSLAVIDGQVLTLSAPCSGQKGCQNPVLRRRPLAGGAWTVVARLRSPSGFTGAVSTDAIATQSQTAAVLDGSSVVVTQDGGVTTSSHATPCATFKAGFATSVAVTSADSLALLCVGGAFTGNTIKMLYTSDDGGVSWALAGRPPVAGDGGDIAGATARRITIATLSAASWLYYSADGGSRWSTARLEPDGGMGWADLGFTTTKDGVVVRAPAFTDGNPGHRAGQLLLTQDAGAHWRLVRF